MPKQTDEFMQRCDKCITYVVVQFYPWFKFYFPLFCGMVMYDNEFDTKEIKIFITSTLKSLAIRAI